MRFLPTRVAQTGSRRDVGSLSMTFLTDDQQQTGMMLLWMAGIDAVAIAWRPMFSQMPGYSPVKHRAT